MKVWYIQMKDLDDMRIVPQSKGYSTFEKAKAAFYDIKDVRYPQKGVLVAIDNRLNFEYAVRAMEIE